MATNDLTPDGYYRRVTAEMSASVRARACSLCAAGLSPNAARAQLVAEFPRIRSRVITPIVATVYTLAIN